MITLKFPGPIPANREFPARGAKDPQPSASASALGDFNRLDYEGWGAKNQDRMSWVPDPLNPSRTVAQLEVRGTDTADQFGGCRASMWRNADNLPGTEGWVSYGFLLPAGFVWPNTWMLIYQMFSSGGNPAQALELRTPPSGGSVRNYLWWKNQTAPTTSRIYHQLAPATLNVWHRVVINTKFSPGLDGHSNVWHSLKTKPDLSQPPLVRFSGRTLYDSSPGRENVFLYRDPSSVPTQIQRILVDSFVRATSKDDL